MPACWMWYIMKGFAGVQGGGIKRPTARIVIALQTWDDITVLQEGMKLPTVEIVLSEIPPSYRRVA
jgi:hypothetical protein